MLLRGGAKTVDELATDLGLTDNAIRAHLTHLERDGLAQQGELRRSGGKPAYTFELTSEAERLFPRAYGVLLNQLLRVLSERMPDEELADVLREVGHLFMALGRPVPAAARYERAVQLQPDEKMNWLGLIRALRAAGDPRVDQLVTRYESRFGPLPREGGTPSTTGAMPPGTTS